MLAILEANFQAGASQQEGSAHTYFTPPCLTEYNLGYETISSHQNRVILEYQTVPQPVKKLPTFYTTQQFNTAFTRPHNLCLS